MTEEVTVLVIAKAPVPGRVKTRLAVDVGDRIAAQVAAAALLDTVAVCSAAFGPSRCRLALDGDLAAGLRGDEICAAVRGWDVVSQVDGHLGQRIAAACSDVGTPVLQVGMDTPQLTSDGLLAAAERLTTHDAVLAPAEDGGWWLLGLRRPTDAAAVSSVPMSTPDTGDLTWRALSDAGLSVFRGPMLRDIDDLADLRAVVDLAPDSRTARVAGEVLR